MLQLSPSRARKVGFVALRTDVVVLSEQYQHAAPFSNMLV